MSVELAPGPYPFTVFHQLGVNFVKQQEANRITTVKMLAEELHNLGISISKKAYQEAIEEADYTDYYYDDDRTVNFQYLINAVHGLGTNGIQRATLRLPNHITKETSDREEMAIVEVIYLKRANPKVDTSYRYVPEIGYTNEPGIVKGGFDGNGEEVHYVSVAEFVQDYKSRIEHWKTFHSKYKLKLKAVEAELKELIKTKKKK